MNDSILLCRMIGWLCPCCHPESLTSQIPLSPLRLNHQPTHYSLSYLTLVALLLQCSESGCVRVNTAAIVSISICLFVNNPLIGDWLFRLWWSLLSNMELSALGGSSWPPYQRPSISCWCEVLDSKLSLKYNYMAAVCCHSLMCRQLMLSRVVFPLRHGALRPCIVWFTHMIDTAQSLTSGQVMSG